MTDPSSEKRIANDAEQTPSSLLHAMKQMRSSGWRRFDRRYRPWLLRKLIYQGERIDRAEDVAQDVLLEVVRKIADFSPGRPGSFRNWLARIAFTRRMEQKRREQKVLECYLQTEQLQQIPAETTEISAGLSDLRLNLYRKMHQLLNERFSSRDIKIVFRYLVDEEAPETIASDYLITPNAVYLVKSRVLKRIREDLPELSAKPN